MTFHVKVINFGLEQNHFFLMEERKKKGFDEVANSGL